MRKLLLIRSIFISFSSLIRGQQNISISGNDSKYMDVDTVYSIYKKWTGRNQYARGDGFFRNPDGYLVLGTTKKVGKNSSDVYIYKQGFASPELLFF